MNTLVYRRPWIGDNYRPESGLLHVGESHYGSPKEADDPDFTRDLVRRYADRKWTHRYFTNITSIVGGKQASVRGRAGFWHSVAFVNYVQDFMEGPGIAPSSTQWVAGTVEFRNIVRKLAPAGLIFLASRLWTTIQQNHPEFEPAEAMQFAWGTWERSKMARDDREPLLATWIKHPSRANIAEWHEVVERFIGESTVHVG
jgi:hypothetical protein